GRVAMPSQFGIELWGRVRDNRIGTNGDGLADEAERNIISGNTAYGVHLLDPSDGRGGPEGTVVAGDFIGTRVSGVTAIGKALVRLYPRGSSGSRIGTDGNGVADAAERNLISGNPRFGLVVAGDGNHVTGNFIGTDATGTAELGNGFGVLLNEGANNV